MVFERVHVWMTIIEKNILYPLLIASLMTTFSWHSFFSVIFLSTLCAFRIARTAYAQPQLLYVPLLGTFVLSTFGLSVHSSQAEKDTSSLPALAILYLLTMLWPKVQEFVLKMNFILSYIAPWQISWGSAFHAFAQPFSVPHTGLIFTQAALSSLFSAPLNPFLGSSFFLMSYVRPVKFWEKDYNTKRVDHSNLRLISQLDRGPMLDDSNLNSIFYEHLTRSLQQSLAGDLLFGRWASTIFPGDCFILASLYLNCLVHIIEVGNGFVTFQVRGLEFRGTYCHQREVEAISEDWTDGGGLCCCTIGSIPGTLSFNNAWALRWLAWEVTAAKYVIDGYSITDNSAVNLLQVHELRRLLVSLYVKCMIYYALSSPNFSKWIMNETILKALEPIQSNSRYVDNDPMFCAANDEDYDPILLGISRQSFIEQYNDWIQYCLEKRKSLKNANPSPYAELLGTEMEYEPTLVTSFCFALGILGRRALSAASYNRHANAAESFLFGLHALFKGDLRVTSQNDEWVCTDPDILSSVIAPAVRMALKLHQDHFAAADDFEEQGQLYERIQHYQSILFISHEHDPAWRQAIIANTPSLLALRHMYDDGQDDYKIIMLNKMHLNMRVIKLNRECVRAFWSGQQQELIFLRNRNPERGSIQNARQVLRNMINSSADQPIGYPIYVSPLTTSFVETHSQLSQVTGPDITFCTIWDAARRLVGRLRRHFDTSGSSNLPANIVNTGASATAPHSNPIGPAVSQAGSTPVPSRKRVSQFIAARAGSIAIGTPTNNSHNERADDSISHVSKITSASITGAIIGEEHSCSAVIKEHRKSESLTKVSITKQDSNPKDKPATGSENPSQADSYAEIVDEHQVLPKLNEPMKATGELLVLWPNDEWRSMGGKHNWTFPIEQGMVGQIVHAWSPFHPNKLFRSFAGHIYLLRVKHEEDIAYVPVLEEGLKFLSKSEHDETPTIEESPLSEME
uniref:Pecanex-like protein n=1 Tax=Acrobeloides nanus TaxID=290746 RepID=A0A914ELU0_9BILA